MNLEHNQIQQTLTERQQTGKSAPITSILFSARHSGTSVDHILVAVDGHVPAVRDYQNDDGDINCWRVSTLHTYSICRCKTFLENSKQQLSTHSLLVSHCVVVNPHHEPVLPGCNTAQVTCSDTEIAYLHRNMKIEVSHGDKNSNPPSISFSVSSAKETDTVTGMFEVCSQVGNYILSWPLIMIDMTFLTGFGNFY